MLKKAFLIACVSVLLSLVIGRLSPSPPVHEAYAQDKARYTVAEYQGMVAVFRIPENRPIQVLYSYVDALPKDMADSIRQGVPVHDEKQLVRLLESLSS